MNNKNKILFWVGAVVLLLVIIWLAARSGYSKPAAPNGNRPAASSTAPVTPSSVAPITGVSLTQVPAGLPVDLPWEKNAKVTQNFTAKDPVTGKTQSTRVYISGQTLDQDFAAYQKYFSNNGWTIVSSLSQPTVKTIQAVKGNAKLGIGITKDSSGQVLVNVTYFN